MDVMEPGRCGRARWTSSRRPRRSGRASCSASTTSCSRRRGVRSAQVLLTFFDISARSHYLNARQTLRKLLRLAGGAGDQRERHHHHRRDLVRRQRLPGRAGGDPARTPRLLLLLTDTDGLYTGDPRTTPGRAGRRGRRLRRARADRHRRVHLAARARAGCARRWWRPRWPPPPGYPAMIASGTREGVIGAALRGEALGTRFQPQAGRVSSFKLWLQATRSRATGGIVVDDGRRARAARARHQPAARGRRRGAGRVPGRRRRGGAAADGRRRDRQGDRELLGRGAAPDQGPEDLRGARAAAARQPRRPCTATTSCSTRPRSANGPVAPGRCELRRLQEPCSLRPVAEQCVATRPIGHLVLAAVRRPRSCLRRPARPPRRCAGTRPGGRPWRTASRTAGPPCAWRASSRGCAERVASSSTLPIGPALAHQRARSRPGRAPSGSRRTRRDRVGAPSCPRPPLDVLCRVRVDGLVRPAVHRCDPPGRRRPRSRRVPPRVPPTGSFQIAVVVGWPLRALDRPRAGPTFTDSSDAS